jgi:hypothetical protein
LSDKSKREKSELYKSVKREKRRNYIILYITTVFILAILMVYGFREGFFTKGNFIENVVNNMIGILPPILLFGIFNEKLSRDSSAIEMSNKITEVLMSNSETLKLFTEEQRKNFISSAVGSIVKDEDVTEMIYDSLKNYYFGAKNFRIRTEFSYNFQLELMRDNNYNIFTNTDDYFYLLERLHYKVKYLEKSVNNINRKEIKIAFVFNSNRLDNIFREGKRSKIYDQCIFRECLDFKQEDIEKLKEIASDEEEFKKIFEKIFKLELRIDDNKGSIEKLTLNKDGIVCVFNVKHNLKIMEHTIKIIFHMPKRWGSILEVALVDPTKAPDISVSYQEEMMDVDMVSFLNKTEKSSLVVTHEQLNGMYNISSKNEWFYPLSGMAFLVNRKKSNIV